MSAVAQDDVRVRLAGIRAEASRALDEVGPCPAGCGLPWTPEHPRAVDADAVSWHQSCLAAARPSPPYQPPRDYRSEWE